MQQLELIMNESAGAEELLDEIIQIEEQAPHLCGVRFKKIKDEHDDWYDLCRAFCEKIGKKPWTLTHIDRLIRYSAFINNIFEPRGSRQIPSEKLVRPLTSLCAEDQLQIWNEIAPGGRHPEAETIKKARDKYDVQMVQLKTKRNRPNKLVFNWTSDMVAWAKWTWNPVFGCKHGCPYCYARDFARRQHRDFGKPELLMHKLACPKNTRIPENKKGEIGIRNVFVCSMADLFGEWVPADWIQKVLNAVNDNPQWTYIFLTKNPARLITIDWPDHACVGATVDCQRRVDETEEAFRNISASVKFLSVEPMNERLEFEYLERFDWVIIGGRSRSSGMPAGQPEWEWVEHLLWQARDADCKVYFKPNLTVRPQECPI